MLKKEETVKGAIVEIYQIKHGIAGGDSLPDNYLLVTKEAGGFFDGGKGVPVGTKLEIVDRPKRRTCGVSTAIVKFPVEGEGEFVGHMYWCSLRVSSKLVQAAPAASAVDAVASKPGKKRGEKVFTEKQLARLPALGYWVCTYKGGAQNFYCVMNGAVKYIHESSSAGEWSTLLWSCCPTAKQVAANEYGTYEHFADHAAMMARFPDCKPGARVKAPNDQ